MDEKPDQCDFCMWETEHLFQVCRPFRSDDPAWLCNVCRNTFAGNAHLYPEQYPDREVLRMIAWQTNFLAAPRARKQEILTGVKSDGTD